MPARSLKTRYNEVADAIGALLVDGTLAILPSERALAKRFTANRATVRNALAILERKNAIHKAHGRGYVVAGRQATPKTLPSGTQDRSRRFRVGYPLWIETLGDLDFSHNQGRLAVVEGLRNELAKLGGELCLEVVGPQNFPNYPRIGAFLREWDAVILEPLERFPRVDASHPFHDLRKKIVVIGHIQNERHNCVAPDIALATKLALDHLVQNGAKRIFFTGDEKDSNPNFFLRLAGLEAAAMRHRGVKIFSGQSGWFTEDGYTAIRQAVTEGHLFDAVVANTPYSGLGALRALFDCGIRVPDQVQLVALGSVPMFRYLVPRMTTVESDLHEVGREAARIAHALVLKNSTPIASRTVPVCLVLGETTSLSRHNSGGSSASIANSPTDAGSVLQ